MMIRTATMADLPAIAQLGAVCFPAAEAATEASFARRLEAYPNHFWVLMNGETIVSFVNGLVTNEPDLQDEMYDNAALHDENGAWQMIFGVDTIPVYRCQGCAERLLRHVIREARTQGRNGLVLTCKEPLLHYYGKFGFVNEGISQSTHGDVRWYQMRLTFQCSTADCARCAGCSQSTDHS